jgi:hypothetical protein
LELLAGCFADAGKAEVVRKSLSPMRFALALDEVGGLIAVNHPVQLSQAAQCVPASKAVRIDIISLPKFIPDFVIRADAFGG